MQATMGGYGVALEVVGAVGAGVGAILAIGVPVGDGDGDGEGEGASGVGAPLACEASAVAGAECGDDARPHAATAVRAKIAVPSPTSRRLMPLERAPGKLVPTLEGWNATLAIATTTLSRP
jgi:hypothetical protein